MIGADSDLTFRDDFSQQDQVFPLIYEEVNLRRRFTVCLNHLATRCHSGAVASRARFSV